MRSPTLSRLAPIAEDQWGLVTRRQAQLAGVPPATLGRVTTGGDVLERVAHGVYRLTGAPIPDHLDLRAAWLQLAPEIPAWERRPEQGVVSHRSAATLYGFGHLPADGHDFTLPKRRQSRRPDVRLHQRRLQDSEWITLRGLPVTRASRIASDLLYDREDPDAVAHLIADAVRGVYDYPGTFADALAPHAARFGLRKDDGLGLLRWLLDLVGDPDTQRWMDEAKEHTGRAAEPERELRRNDDERGLLRPRHVSPRADRSAAGDRTGESLDAAAAPTADCLRPTARTALPRPRRVDRQG